LGTEKDCVNAHPSTAELVVEVAVSSAALDLENASLYAEAGVKEYWIVFGLEHRVEVYRQPDHGCYRDRRVFGLDETIECASLPGVQIAVRDMFEPR